MTNTPLRTFSVKPDRIRGDEGEIASDEKQLLEDFVVRGNKESFNLLVERYQAGLFARCQYILRDFAEAEDALQTTFSSSFARRNRSANPR